MTDKYFGLFQEYFGRFEGILVESQLHAGEDKDNKQNAGHDGFLDYGFSLEDIEGSSHGELADHADEKEKMKSGSRTALQQYQDQNADAYNDG